MKDQSMIQKLVIQNKLTPTVTNYIIYWINMKKTIFRCIKNSTTVFSKKREIWGSKPERDIRDGRRKWFESKEFEADKGVTAPTPWKRVAIGSHKNNAMKIKSKWWEQRKNGGYIYLYKGKWAEKLRKIVGFLCLSFYVW